MHPVRIVQLTDLHVFRDPAGRLRGIPTRESLQEIVDHIRESGQHFDHLIVTGDHTHDELAESYQSVRAALKPWLDCLWQVPGNHDDRRVLRSVFSDRITGSGDEPVRFAFTAGHWLILGLDTHVPGEVFGRMDAMQIDWIRSQLNAHRDRRVACFMHHPPVDVGSAWMDPIGLQGKELFQQLLLDEPQIRLVCCGHVHHEFSCTIGHARVVTTPSTGIQFDPDGNVPTFAAQAPGYRIIALGDQEAVSRVERLAEVRYAPTAD